MRKAKMSHSEINSYPKWLNATLASDAAGGIGILPGWITALISQAVVVGPAFVVLASQDDNQAVRRAIESPPPPGCVLVVAGQNGSRTATIGGLMALEFKNLGVGGLVTDGLVRDSQEIIQFNFPVWCRGITPVAPNKVNQGVLGSPVAIGGVFIRQGDLVIGDADGVVIWKQEEISQLLLKAEDRLDKDNARLKRLQEKQTAPLFPDGSK
jgi:regulator of RNase E activity RraA